MSEFYPYPESFDQVPAGDLKVGDKTRFSYGPNVTVRMISRIEMSYGIVRMWHRETFEGYHDEVGETYSVPRLRADAKPVASAYEGWEPRVGRIREGENDA